MKKLFVLFVIVGALSSCGLIDLKPIIPSATLVSRNLDTSAFDSVSVSGAWDCTITYGDTCTVSFETNDNLSSYIDFSVLDGELQVGFKDSVWIFGVATLKASITIPLIGSIQASGASVINADSIPSAETLRILASGASKVNLAAMSASQIEANISGASNLSFDSGATTSQQLTLLASGASYFNSSEIVFETAAVTISGASTGRFMCSGNTSGYLSGASSIYLGGKGTSTVLVSGASSITIL